MSNEYTNKIMEIVASLKKPRDLTKKLKIFYPEIYKDIDKHWKDVYDFKYIYFSEAINFYLRPDMSFICPYGKRRKTLGFLTEFICERNCECSKAKREKTLIKKYGNDYQKDIFEKTKETFKKKYNTDLLSEINKDKKEKTNINRYGTKIPLQSNIIKNKIKETTKKNLNCEYPFQSQELQQKIQKENYEKYGKFSKPRTSIDLKQQNAEFYNSHNRSDLLNIDIFKKLLSEKTREEIANLYNCSISLIDKKIYEYNITEHMHISSHYEMLIGNFLISNDIAFIKNTRKIIKPKELDFYIEKNNFAIEFHGSNWHSELLGKKNKNYHLEKYNLCKQKNIHLIQIFQDEWHHNSDIVKSIILSKVGKIKDIRYARNGIVKKINNKEAEMFLDMNHLQGKSIGCFANYGLFFDNELYSVMTFKKTKYGIELSRYVNKVYSIVVGSAQKLLKEFEKEYVPTEIYTYSDKRYFTGNVYISCGFDKVNDTDPGYWYFKNSYKREHRLNFTKKKLISNGASANKTEWEIMQEMGYDRIWDCGNHKFIKKYYKE